MIPPVFKKLGIMIPAYRIKCHCSTRSGPGRRGAVGTRPSPRTTTISVVRPWLMHGQHHHRITTVVLATGLLHGQDQPPHQPANLRDAQRDPRPRPALNAASGLASGGAAAFFYMPPPPSLPRAG